MLSSAKMLTVLSTCNVFSYNVCVSWNIQKVTDPLNMTIAQSIRKIHQYGNEFFVKYQFNILSNGFLIYLYASKPLQS